MNIERYVICIVHYSLFIMRCTLYTTICISNFTYYEIPIHFWKTYVKSRRLLTWFLGSVTYTGAGWILSGPTLESMFSRVISHMWKLHMILFLFAKKSGVTSFLELFHIILSSAQQLLAILIKQLQAMTWRPSFWPCKKVLLSLCMT